MSSFTIEGSDTCGTTFVTEVDDEPEGADAFFPQVSSDLWKVSSREEHGKDEKHDYTYTFTDYIRR